MTLTHTLAALLRWPATPAEPPDWATLEDIVQFCDEIIIGSDRQEIRFALDRLILTPEHLGFEPLEHWEQERRNARLLTRPLVMRTDQKVAIMPWAIESSLRVYLRYISDGRLPWTRGTTPPQVLTAMDAYRQKRNMALEDDVYQRIAGLGYPCRKRVKPNKADSIGLERLSGEIDVLLAAPEQSVLWILEVKDPQEAFSPRQLSNGIDDFVGTASREGYISKLQRKARDVSTNPIANATALGFVESNREWNVRPAMVTRRPVAAAFANTNIPFVTIDDIVRLVGPSHTE